MELHWEGSAPAACSAGLFFVKQVLMTDVHVAVVALEAGSGRVGWVLAGKLVPAQGRRSKLQMIPEGTRVKFSQADVRQTRY